MHREAEPEVRVVIEIRARRDDPIHEPGFYERNKRRHAQASRRERARDRQTDRHIRIKHLSGEQLTGLAKTSGIVGEVSALDEISYRFFSIDATWIDALSLEEAARLVSGMLRTALLTIFGGQFLSRLRSGSRCLSMP